MRITQKEIDVLKRKLYQLSPEAKLYLFGSRVDDTKRGGDIDLLIEDSNLTKKDIRLLKLEFFKHFGEQKLDIILDRGQDDPFIQIIKQNAILL